MPVADQSLFSCLRNVWLSKSRFRIEMTLHDFFFALVEFVFNLYPVAQSFLLVKPHLCIFPSHFIFTFIVDTQLFFGLPYHTHLFCLQPIYFSCYAFYCIFQSKGCFYDDIIFIFSALCNECSSFCHKTWNFLFERLLLMDIVVK